MFDLLIHGGRMVDGNGTPWRYADVGVDAGRVTAIGHLDDAEAKLRVDATGYVVCPGFIDSHSHADLTLLAGRWIDARLLQGITTEVIGQDGLSYAPATGHHLQQWRRYLSGLNGDFPEIDWRWSSVAEFLRGYEGRAANVAYMLPHGAIRVESMGWDARPATSGELRAMARLVQQGMEEGACGLSTGLTYMPCAHATTEEMIALCRPVAKSGGVYATHLRSYGPRFLEAIDEAVEIGRRSGVAVHISHLRVADPSLAGLAERILARIDAARTSGVDVTFDVYPYIVGCAPLFCLIPPWAQEGGPEVMLARLGDPAACRQMSDEMANWQVDWNWYTLSNAPETAFGSWEGMSLPEAADRAGLATWAFIPRLLLETGLNATIIARGGSQADNDAIFAHPAGMICSDGILLGGKPHPRGYGAFPRMLAEYVRVKHLLRLEEAVHRMTGLAAGRLGIEDRGVLRRGAAADIVVFSADEIADAADFEDGRRPPRGIEWVFVNGQAAVAHGEFRGGDGGTVIRPRTCT